MKIIIEKQLNQKQSDYDQEVVFLTTNNQPNLILKWNLINNLDKWAYGNVKKLVFSILTLQKNLKKELRISYFKWNRNLDFLISFLKNRKFNFNDFKISAEFEQLLIRKDLIKIRKEFLSSDEYTKQLINLFLLTKVKTLDQKFLNSGINENIISNEIFFNYLLDNYFNYD